MNPSNKPVYGRAMDYARAGLIGATGLLVAACASPTQEERFARFLKENDKAFSTTIEACLKTYDGKPLPAREQQTANFFKEQVQKQYGAEAVQGLDDVTAYCSDRAASDFANEFARLGREADARFDRLEREAYERFRRKAMMDNFDNFKRQTMYLRRRQVKPN